MSEPAFPVQDAASWQAHGITNRDYFAAKAMQAYLSHTQMLDVDYYTVASWSYQMADAMLAIKEL